VPARQHRAGLQHLFVAALQNFAQQIQIHRLGKAYDIQRGQGPPAHRVNVAQSVRRRDLPEQIRILHHRREEIQRGDQRLLVVDAVHRRVVVAVKADQQVFVGLFGQLAQHAAQRPGPQLGRAAAAGAK